MPCFAQGLLITKFVYMLPFSFKVLRIPIANMPSHGEGHVAHFTGVTSHIFIKGKSSPRRASFNASSEVFFITPNHAASISTTLSHHLQISLLFFSASGRWTVRECLI